MTEELIHIKPLSQLDFDEIVAISDLQFGSSYIQMDQITARLEKVNDIGISITVNQRLLGFALSERTTPNRLNAILHQSEIDVIDYFKNSNVITWIDTIAVSPEAIGKGLGKKMIQNLMPISKNKGEAVLSVVWEHKKGNPLATIYEHLGFERLQYIPNYWSADSLKKGYSCLYCGNPPCQCSAIIYGFK